MELYFSFVFKLCLWIFFSYWASWNFQELWIHQGSIQDKSTVLTTWGIRSNKLAVDMPLAASKQKPALRDNSQWAVTRKVFLSKKNCRTVLGNEGNMNLCESLPEAYRGVSRFPEDGYNCQAKTLLHSTITHLLVLGTQHIQISVFVVRLYPITYLQIDQLQKKAHCGNEKH